MRVLLLSAGNVVHTQRWANGLVDAGVEVVCVSQHPFLDSGWRPDVVRVSLPLAGPLGYFLNAGVVRRHFVERRCDLMNAHYATGYGVLATLSRVRPRLVSVWGSDVYDFPAKSALHRALVRWVLHRAQGVASTSRVMAEQVRRVMPKGWTRDIDLTPFGVDLEAFQASAGSHEAGQREPLVIGTVKTLAPKYGIDTLVRAFALLVSDVSVTTALPAGLRLCLVGGGEQRVELEELVRTLGLTSRVEFVGNVPHAEVPAYLRRFDIYAAASRLDSESFGVAIIEASACGLPVVVTRVGGLVEVVRDGDTGLIVDRENPVALAAALRQLVLDPGLRQRLGENGRSLVTQCYDWTGCVRHMVEVYRRIAMVAPVGRSTPGAEEDSP